MSNIEELKKLINSDNNQEKNKGLNILSKHINIRTKQLEAKHHIKFKLRPLSTNGYYNQPLISNMMFPPFVAPIVSPIILPLSNFSNTNTNALEKRFELIKEHLKIINEIDTAITNAGDNEEKRKAINKEFFSFENDYKKEIIDHLNEIIS